MKNDALNVFGAMFTEGKGNQPTRWAARHGRFRSSWESSGAVVPVLPFNCSRFF